VAPAQWILIPETKKGEKMNTLRGDAVLGRSIDFLGFWQVPIDDVDRR
jgi:hypothetical protein